ncbi:MAG: hypothetical protein J6Y37_11420 [Paludibacteraceae bacterium]|nr:hypothetical protein [Paludibacteraceae bacterium]
MDNVKTVVMPYSLPESRRKVCEIGIQNMTIKYVQPDDSNHRSDKYDEQTITISTEDCIANKEDILKKQSYYYTIRTDRWAFMDAEELAILLKDFESRLYNNLDEIRRYCVDDNTYDRFNGHDYVDLGLPSGTLWATCNVGASSPTDSGLYFAWGETTGYTAAQVGTDKNFTWADYGLGNGSDDAAMTKYNSTDGLTSLQAVDDAASVNMGGDWRMPDVAQLGELLDERYVTHHWVTDYHDSGVNGRKFISKINGNSIFFPAAGDIWHGKLKYVGDYGWIWSKSITSDNTIDARVLYIEPDNAHVNINSSNRFFGFTVRGVLPIADDR